jgi:outer membrane immunogenic protein
MTRKGYLLATAGSVAAVAAAGGAQAADMPVKAPWAPTESWAGWYIGLNAGANWQQALNDSDSYGSANTNASGFIGGGQIGYNWQNGNGVFGLEADLDGLTGSGKTSAYTPSGKNYSNQIQWLSTVRGRVGLAVGNTMAYATGGVAIGGVKNSWNGIFAGSKSESATRVGWTVGGGVEHMMGSHFTLGVEALFVDLGQSTITNSVGKTATFSNQAVIGRVKLNYKW